MTSIGSFKEVVNEFQGQIVTLSVQAKAARGARNQPRQRQRPFSPRVRWEGRDRRRLDEALERGPRPPLGQAR